jgi:hypothetical protein
MLLENTVQIYQVKVLLRAMSRYKAGKVMKRRGVINERMSINVL